jgi:hypothetical protein
MFIADTGVSGNHWFALPSARTPFAARFSPPATSRFGFQSAIRVRTALKPSEGVSVAVPSKGRELAFAVP